MASVTINVKGKEGRPISVNPGAAQEVVQKGLGLKMFQRGQAEAEVIVTSADIKAAKQAAMELGKGQFGGQKWHVEINPGQE